MCNCNNKYSISFPGNCGCNQGVYSTNMWNVNGNNPSYNGSCGHQQACNSCLDIVKGKCIVYTGTNLINTGINQNDTLDAVLGKLDAIKKILDDQIAALTTRVAILETPIPSR